MAAALYTRRVHVDKLGLGESLLWSGQRHSVAPEIICKYKFLDLVEARMREFGSFGVTK